jgi:ABC-2 type transport system ATP-binding protein
MRPGGQHPCFQARANTTMNGAMTATTDTIELRGLTKRFGATVAVDDLTASARPGSVTAFLGPNGAGKTTTLRMLLGLIAPTAGTATIGGRRYDELPEPVREVGAMLEASGFHPGRTALDHLRVLAVAAGLPADAPARVLDEPTNGLDPQGIRWLRRYLSELADEGRTLLVSSHVLAEVEQFADEVIVIAHGRLVRSTSLAELRTEAGIGSRVRSPESDRLCGLLSGAGHGVREDGTDELVVDAAPELVGQLAAQHGVVLHRLVATGSLEDVFIRLTEEAER